MPTACRPVKGKGNRFHGCLFRRSSYRSESVGHIRKECHLTRSLDRGGKLSLVKSAGAADASRKDLGSFGNEFPEFGNILIIDFVHLVLAEEAYFLSSVHRTEGGTGCIVSFHVGKNPFRLTVSISPHAVSRTRGGGGASQKGRLSSPGISSKLEFCVLLKAGAPYAFGV